MSNYRWGVFGEVPDKHRDWFIRESGTYYNPEKDDWFVDGTKVISGTEKTSSSPGVVIKNAKYRSNLFQDAMVKARDAIKMGMPPRCSYVITNELVFGLMRNTEVSIPYKYNGQDYQQKIHL